MPISIVVVIVAAASMLGVILIDHFAGKQGESFSSFSVSKQMASSAITNPTTIKYNPAHGSPGHRCDIPDGAPLPQADKATMPMSSSLINLPSNSSTEKKDISEELSKVAKNLNQDTTPAIASINPPHGQPGHRCGSAADASNKISTTDIKSTNSSSTLSTPNPPHGQPGHRCGAAESPINTSSVKTNNSGDSSSATNVNTELKDSIHSNAAKSQDTSQVRLNPAHGQPGHVCSVGTGKPLPKKQ